MLRALLAEGAKFMVVGAHALSLYDAPRTTGDFDIWIGPGRTNAERVYRALQRFGAPTEALGVGVDELAEGGNVIQVGLAPRRIDLLTELSGLDFESASRRIVLREMEGLAVPFIGKDDLVRNKRATGRLKDLADIERLEGSE